MPSPSSPRVNVVVTPEQHRYLMTLARYQNRSAASLVREMIDAAEPLMKRTVDLLALTEEADTIRREKAVEAIRSVLEELADLTGTSDQMDLLGLLSGDSEGMEADATARSGAREEASASPRLVTRGSGRADPCTDGGAKRG